MFHSSAYKFEGVDIGKFLKVYVSPSVSDPL